MPPLTKPPEVEFRKQPTLSPEDKKQVLRLWNEEFPESLCHPTLKDLEHYLQGLDAPSHLLMTDAEAHIRGWFVHFLREEQPWFVMIVDAAWQGRGYGSGLLRRGREGKSSLCGWVIDHNRALKMNGETYRSPLEFYLKNGFRVVRRVRLELDAISAVKMVWRRG